MNKSLQKSYYDSKTAFKPAGAVKDSISPTASPLRDRKDLFKFRSANNSDLNVNNNNPEHAGSLNSLRRTKTEHAEKFLPWEYSNKEQNLNPEHKYSSLYNFNVDMNVAGWESEAHRSFKPNYSQLKEDLSRPAGVSRGKHVSEETAYAWEGSEPGIYFNIFLLSPL
jgi:hypothetical protein